MNELSPGYHSVDMREAEIIVTLRTAGCVFAEDEAALLIAAAHSPEDLAAMVARRVVGEPLEVIVGWADFAGIRVLIEPGVFVPRQRSALLVDRAARVAAAGDVVVDLCCGSGALGAAIAARVAGVRLYAADIEPAAVRCARRNLEGLGSVFEGDLYAALPGSLRGTVDILIVNAPYVPTDAIGMMPPEARDYEPLVALDGGDDGLDIHRRVAAGASGWLASSGVLLIEASEEQAPVSAALFEAQGLSASIVTDDELGASAVLVTRAVP
jgi:release factor glutamine methyltransferase